MIPESPRQRRAKRDFQESELRSALLSLKGCTDQGRIEDPMSKGSWLLSEIDNWVRALDSPQKRRKPWPAYQEVDRKIRDIKLTTAISEFVSTCCRYLKAKSDTGDLQLPKRQDMERLSELARAAKEDQLLKAVQVTDPDLLRKYCSPSLTQLYDKGVKLDADHAWRVWPFAMFHDVWHKRRSQITDVLTSGNLQFFVERIEHEPFVVQLGRAIPSVARSLKDIQKERRSRTNRERRKR